MKSITTLACLVACLVFAIAALLVWLLDYALRPTPNSYDLAKSILELVIIPLLVGIAGSAASGALIFQKIEQASQQRMLDESKQLASGFVRSLKDEFIPDEIFGLSNEDDPKFHDAIMSDLKRSSTFHFSGLSARVAIARIWEDPDSSGVALIRLPLSVSSIDRAVRILNNLRRMKPGGSNEFSGVRKDRARLIELAQRNDPHSLREYINEIVNDSILFASHVSDKGNWRFFIQDWDETVEYRIEFFETAVYLGNYHPPGGSSQFGPGTVRYLSNSHIYKLISESIRLQRLNAESGSNGKTLRLEPGKVNIVHLISYVKDMRNGADLLQDIGSTTAGERLNDYKAHLLETIGFVRNKRSAGTQ